MDRLDVVAEWLGRKPEMDPEWVDPAFLPDPAAPNWMGDVLVAAQRNGDAPLYVQAAFNQTSVLTARLSSGDVFGAYLGRTATPMWVLHRSSEPYQWVSGGTIGPHAERIERFLERWTPRIPEFMAIHQVTKTASHPAKAWKLLERRKKDQPLLALARAFVEDFESSFPSGRLLPDVFRTAEEREQQAACFSEPGWDPEWTAANFFNKLVLHTLCDRPQSAPWLLGDSNAWIVRTILGERAIDRSARDGWCAHIDRLLDAPSPAVGLDVWPALFFRHRTDEAVARASDHPWRLIRDSARLIDDFLRQGRSSVIRCEVWDSGR